MKKETKTIPIAEVIPYERNPRKNDIAVDDVAESIRQCGYIAPIIVDEDMVVLCGHTRLKALKKLGWKECEVTVVTGMTEEQKKKYRLLDNKVAEKAIWDFELLDWELSELDFEEYDFGFEIVDELEIDENDLDDNRSKDKCTVTIRFDNHEIYQTISEQLKELVDIEGAKMSVKME